jgi:hypothetical protein
VMYLAVTKNKGEMDDGGFDLRFKNPSSFILGGVSQSGKTTFTLNLLRNIDQLFEDPRCKQNIIYFYKQWQESYENFKRENIVREWINHLLTEDDIKEKTLLYKDRGGSVIVVDDFAQELNKDIANIFSIYAHHTNSIVILLTQNIFSKNPVFRDISLNANYIILFKNIRDASQIVHLAKQFAPGNNTYVIEAYKDATKNAYSYLLFDLHQAQFDNLRLRSRILPHELPMCIYEKKK